MTMWVIYTERIICRVFNCTCPAEFDWLPVATIFVRIHTHWRLGPLTLAQRSSDSVYPRHGPKGDWYSTRYI